MVETPESYLDLIPGFEALPLSCRATVILSDDSAKAFRPIPFSLRWRMMRGGFVTRSES